MNFLGAPGVIFLMRLPLTLVSFVGLGWAAPNPEAGRIERSGDTATLLVEYARPVDSAAITLAEEFGLRINVEDPPYVCAEDKVDVSRQVRKRPGPPLFVPRTRSLAVRFALAPEGRPADPDAVVEQLVRVANEALGFAYRAVKSGDAWTLTPTRTRDQLCNTVEYLPLLDRRVTIPRGVRPVAASANLLAEALSDQTGLRISCCEGAIAGIPWGLEEAEFGAENERARSVLTRLIELTLHDRPSPYYWLQRCDPLPSEWCAISLMRLPGERPSGPPLPPPH